MARLRFRFGRPLQRLTNKIYRKTGNSEKRLKAEHPFWWMVVRVLEKLDDSLDVFRWIRRKFVFGLIYRTWMLPTGVKFGEYSDLTSRLPYAMFNGLKDFVEIELNKEDSRYKRNPAAGIKHLQEQIDDPSFPLRQRQIAQEVLEIYDWWVNKRPAREDAFSEVRYLEFQQQLYGGTKENFLETLQRRGRNDFKKLLMNDTSETVTDIEQLHLAEDTDFMVRLCRIHHHLWD